MAKTNVNKQSKKAEKIVQRVKRKFERHQLHTGSTERLVKDKKEAIAMALEKAQEKGETLASMEHEKTQPGKSMKTKSNKHKRTHDDKW